MAEFDNENSVARLLLSAAGQDLAACRLLATGAGIEFHRTHDLALLLDLLQDNHVASPPEADWLDELNPYAVEARYGTIKPEGLDRERVLKAIADVMAWADKQVKATQRSGGGELDH